MSTLFRFASSVQHPTCNQHYSKTARTTKYYYLLLSHRGATDIAHGLALASGMSHWSQLKLALIQHGEPLDSLHTHTWHLQCKLVVIISVRNSTIPSCVSLLLSQENTLEAADNKHQEFGVT